jgi:hypothetical protein
MAGREYEKIKQKHEKSRQEVKTTGDLFSQCSISIQYLPKRQHVHCRQRIPSCLHRLEERNTAMAA